ncbi:MAG: helix-turn-helix transcriptional regulator [Bacilli bacterium]|nr:helix-turn-helix transcriptional regulator [Bacilli bacterium]
MLYNLQKIRKNNNLTYDSIAKKLNISKTYYWQIEHGKRRLSYSLALKIAALFNMKPDDLFHEDIKNIDKF